MHDRVAYRQCSEAHKIRCAALLHMQKAQAAPLKVRAVRIFVSFVHPSGEAGSAVTSRSPCSSMASTSADASELAINPPRVQYSLHSLILMTFQTRSFCAGHRPFHQMANGGVYVIPE